MEVIKLHSQAQRVVMRTEWQCAAIYKALYQNKSHSPEAPSSKLWAQLRAQKVQSWRPEEGGAFYRPQRWGNLRLLLANPHKLIIMERSPCWASYSLFLIMYPSLINFLFPHTLSSTLTDIIRGPQEWFWEMPFPRAVQSNFLEPAIKGDAYLCLQMCHMTYLLNKTAKHISHLFSSFPDIIESVTYECALFLILFIEK